MSRFLVTLGNRVRRDCFRLLFAFDEALLPLVVYRLFQHYAERCFHVSSSFYFLVYTESNHCATVSLYEYSLLTLYTIIAEIDEFLYIATTYGLPRETTNTSS